MGNPNAIEKLRSGLVIPAHPLALDIDSRLDERRQRALSRYYLSAGAGGLAVGVHTTQFAIHDPDVGLYRLVLELRKMKGEKVLPLRGLWMKYAGPGSRGK